MLFTTPTKGTPKMNADPNALLSKIDQVTTQVMAEIAEWPRHCFRGKRSEARAKARRIIAADAAKGQAGLIADQPVAVAVRQVLWNVGN